MRLAHNSSAFSRPNHGNRRLRLMRWFALLLVLTGVLAAVGTWIVFAANLTWNGNFSNFWSDGTNWFPNQVPATGDALVLTIGSENRPNNNDLPASVQLQSVTLNDNTFVGGYNINGNAVILQSGGSVTNNNTSTTSTFNVGITLNGSATFTASTAQNLVLNGAVTGTGGLTLTNSGGTADALQLNAADTYSGATTVNGSAEVLANVNGAIPTGSALTVSSGGSIKFGAGSTIGSLAGGANVFMSGSNALTVGGDNTSTTFSGVYQNSGGSAALTKIGTGTLTLSGANTYTGPTTVNAGTLLVNGSLAVASAVTVNNTATLDGAGTVGAVTVNNGGTLAPGNSPGIINTGNLSLTSGSTLAIELNGPTVSTQYDQVNVTGTVSLGNATLNVSLGFTPTGGQVFTIINNDGSDPVSGMFAGLAEGNTFTAGGRQFRISYVGGDGNDVTLTVLKANQTISFAAIGPKTFGDPDFMVNPTASSGLPVSLIASGNCTVTTPAPGTVHTTGAGACTITASQAGDANFNAAANVSQSFNIAKASQAITFNALANKTFGDPDFTVSATASSGLPVSFTASGQCTVSGNTVHLTGAGSCTIEASQAGDENYNEAIDIARTFSIAKANQTITFNALANKTFGDADFNVSATASSGLPVSFAATGNCTIAGNTVHLTGAGSCTITASQAGNANYNAAPNVPQTFSIAKANQTITFGALANKTFGDADFNVSATASSGLPVSFSATGNCTISGNTVHLTGAGSCTITASQAGDSNYNAAPNVAQSFTIAKANQTINFNALANKIFGDADFNVSATASSGLPVSFTATGNCTISGNTVHLTGAGSCTITAAQAGNANYNAAANVAQTFTIAKASTITALLSSVNPSSFGQNVTFTATVTSGAGTPSGIAQFKDNGANLGAPVALNGSGVATFTTSSLSAGTHTITAEYSSDANFAASTGALTGGQVVNAQPGLSINDVSNTEGDSGTKTMTFTVTLAAASNLTVTVNFATANGTATAPSDYLATSGTLTFNPGDLTKTIGVTINGDQLFEPDETFTVNLSNPVNTTISKATGIGTILNDDAQGGIISFSQPNYSVAESGGSITITVNRTGDTTGPATADYTTPDDSAALTVLPCSTPSGIALPRCDFTTALGTLRFAPGETVKTFIVLISQDNFVEGPETLPLTLSNLTGGAVFGSFSTATLTINDDLTEPAANPIDDAANYVRQQYHDFLLREPDAAGLAFWTNNIDNCTPKPACTDLQRINTSAAFFLSVEFQQSGYYVYRTYKAGLGDINAPTVPVPIRFRDFIRDTAEVDRGVVVGVGNWQAQLDANKQAFALAFVQRPDFLARYPNSTSAAAFVNALDTNAGAVLTNLERTALIAELTPNPADTALRADVVMKIAENLLLQQHEFNRAFVLMQYIGYLRRNPDAAPDLNFAGFNFWLNKLNQFNGNFVQAEMVKAFITSNEYRQRFGQ